MEEIPDSEVTAPHQASEGPRSALTGEAEECRCSPQRREEPHGVGGVQSPRVPGEPPQGPEGAQRDAAPTPAKGGGDARLQSFQDLEIRSL